MPEPEPSQMVSCEGKAGGGQVSPAPRMPCRRAERVRRLRVLARARASAMNERQSTYYYS